MGVFEDFSRNLVTVNSMVMIVQQSRILEALDKITDHLSTYGSATERPRQKARRG
jgi:hypothetical protein